MRREIFTELTHPKYLDPKWMPEATRFYCLHCGSPDGSDRGFGSLHAVDQHVRAEHGVFDWERGSDHHGTAAQFLNERRVYWEVLEKKVARFHHRLLSCIGADDIFIDAQLRPPPDGVLEWS